jgi:DNA-directed RNA polymerase specialized sigma24 family protein
LPRRLLEPAPVLDQAPHLVGTAHRAVSGHQPVGAEREQTLQRRHPALRRPRPHDGISGHSYVEIQAVTGATYTNVRKHLYRARRNIRASRAA